MSQDPSTPNEGCSEPAAQTNDGRAAKPPRAAEGPLSLARLLPFGVLFAAGLIAYVDLKLDLQALTAQHERPAEEAAAGSPPPGTMAPQEGEKRHSTAPSKPESAPLPRSQWQCSGTIATEELRKAVGQFGPTVFRCHEELERGGSKLAGTFVLELMIDAGGRPQNGAFSGTLQDPALQGCVRASIPQWQFPAPQGGECAVVSLPFQLGTPAGS